MNFVLFQQPFLKVLPLVIRLEFGLGIRSYVVAATVQL